MVEILDTEWKMLATAFTMKKETIISQLDDNLLIFYLIILIYALKQLIPICTTNIYRSEDVISFENPLGGCTSILLQNI
ncbi:MAG: hypothetical protein ACEY3J_00215 [Arsenophonus sp.]